MYILKIQQLLSSESTNNIEDNYKQIVEADNKIAMESNIPTKYKLFYVNNSTKRNGW